MPAVVLASLREYPTAIFGVRTCPALAIMGLLVLSTFREGLGNCLIDFSGVEKLVDAVGGVTVTNVYAFSTARSQFPLGRIELNGEEALAYSRAEPDGRYRAGFPRDVNRRHAGYGANPRGRCLGL